MRFRTAGRGWELAPSLVVLAHQVEQEWPARHAADGTLGNLEHSARKSDHNPDANAVVHAIDVGEVTEDDAFQLAEALRLSRDERIKYVIHERRMYSFYERNGIAPFTWRYYDGPNGHWSHVHVSSRTEYDYITRPWDLGGDTMPLNQLQRTIVDLAFAHGAEGDPNYWYGKEPNDPEFADLSAAVRRNKHAGGRDEEAHARLDKLHTV